MMVRATQGKCETAVMELAVLTTAVATLSFNKKQSEAGPSKTIRWSNFNLNCKLNLNCNINCSFNLNFNLNCTSTVEVDEADVEVKVGVDDEVDG